MAKITILACGRLCLKARMAGVANIASPIGLKHSATTLPNRSGLVIIAPYRGSCKAELIGFQEKSQSGLIPTLYSSAWAGYILVLTNSFFTEPSKNSIVRHNSTL